jgi:hypothetical protein
MIVFYSSRDPWVELTGAPGSNPLDHGRPRARNGIRGDRSEKKISR